MRVPGRRRGSGVVRGRVVVRGHDRRAPLPRRVVPLPPVEHAELHLVPGLAAWSSARRRQLPSPLAPERESVRNSCPSAARLLLERGEQIRAPCCGTAAGSAVSHRASDASEVRSSALHGLRQQVDEYEKTSSRCLRYDSSAKASDPGFLRAAAPSSAPVGGSSWWSTMEQPNLPHSMRRGR